jgi:hypothetical protein
MAASREHDAMLLAVYQAQADHRHWNNGFTLAPCDVLAIHEGHYSCR